MISLLEEKELISASLFNSSFTAIFDIFDFEETEDLNIDELVSTYLSSCGVAFMT